MLERSTIISLINSGAEARILHISICSTSPCWLCLYYKTFCAFCTFCNLNLNPVLACFLNSLAIACLGENIIVRWKRTSIAKGCEGLLCNSWCIILQWLSEFPASCKTAAYSSRALQNIPLYETNWFCLFFKNYWVFFPWADKQFFPAFVTRTPKTNFVLLKILVFSN